MPKTKFWKIVASAEKEYHLDLFGVVGGEWGEGIETEAFLEDFRKVPNDADLKISINTFGGDVYTALAINSLLQSHKGSITFRVDGVAMSAGTVITSVPGAKVIVPKGSLMMIHHIRGGYFGNPNELHKKADDMAKIENNVIDLYVAKTGRTREEVVEAVDAETFFTAEEAVEFGLADEVDDKTVVHNCARGEVADLNGLQAPMSIFAHAPAGFLPDADNSAQTPDHIEEKPKMDMETLKAECPELVAALREEGAQAERARVADIDALRIVGHDQLVAEAKADGTMTAEKLAVRVVKAEAEARVLAAKKVKADATAVADAIDATAGNVGIKSEPSDGLSDSQRAMLAAAKKRFSK